MTKTKTLILIFTACAGVGVLVIGSCAGLLYSGYKNTEAAISPRIDSMFAAMDNQSFSATYETETTQELRNVVSKEQYSALGDTIQTRLGRMNSKSLQGFKMQKSTNGAFIDVSYQAKFESGDGTILARLKKEGSEWKFVNFRVNSPLFLQDIATTKCASCGKAHAANAKFCPSCGTKVGPAPTKENEENQSSTEQGRGS
jgi:hypothetical protein